jgi:hypothetical protein
MKVDGSEKGELGSAMVVPRRDISYTSHITSEKKIHTLLLVRNSLNVEASSVCTVKVPAGPRDFTDGIYSER